MAMSWRGGGGGRGYGNGHRAKRKPRRRAVITDFGVWVLPVHVRQNKKKRVHHGCIHLASLHNYTSCTGPGVRQNDDYYLHGRLVCRKTMRIVFRKTIRIGLATCHGCVKARCVIERLRVLQGSCCNGYNIRSQCVRKCFRLTTACASIASLGHLPKRKVMPPMCLSDLRTISAAAR